MIKNNTASEIVQEWYTNKGISTSIFFDNNSTEVATDLMMDDFALRAIEKMQQLETTVKEAKKLIELFQMNLNSIKGDNPILISLEERAIAYLKKGEGNEC